MKEEVNWQKEKSVLEEENTLLNMSVILHPSTQLSWKNNTFCVLVLLRF